MEEKTIYLGDGVYAHHTGYSIELSVNDHNNPPVVVLELDMIDRLKKFSDKNKK